MCSSLFSQYSSQCMVQKRCSTSDEWAVSQQPQFIVVTTNLRDMLPKAASELVTADLGANAAPSLVVGVFLLWSASASSCLSETQVAALQVCWLSLFPALAVTPPGKASFTGAYRSGAAQVWSFTGSYRSGVTKDTLWVWMLRQGLFGFLAFMLGGVPQGAAASTIAAPNQQHLEGNTLLGSGPAAGIKENLSLQWQLLTLCNKKKCPSFWSPRLPCAVAAHAPWGVRGGTIKAAPQTGLVMHFCDEQDSALPAQDSKARNRTFLWLAHKGWVFQLSQGEITRSIQCCLWQEPEKFI